MRIDEIELRIVHLPYRSVFKTSFAAESAKTAVLVTVRSEGVEGYGEGVVDPLPPYREGTNPGGEGPQGAGASGQGGHWRRRTPPGNGPAVWVRTRTPQLPGQAWYGGYGAWRLP